MTQVIVLNGGSSSGKSGIARCLQAVLPEPWLVMGIDSTSRRRPSQPAGCREGDPRDDQRPEGDPRNLADVAKATLAAPATSAIGHQHR